MGRKNDILIIGAGLVGSLLARLLAQRGNQVKVVEYRPDPRKVSSEEGGRSINLTLCHRGWTALESAGLKEEVQAIASPLDGRVIHTTDGALQSQAYGRPGDSIFAIGRTQLGSLLVEAADRLPEVECLFETRCLDIDLAAMRVELRDKEGIRHFLEADLIIGADGVHSVCRNSLVAQGHLSDTLDTLDYGYKELILRDHDSEELARRAFHLWPRKRFMLAASPNLGEDFTATLLLPFSGPHSFDALKTPGEVRTFFERFFPDTLPYLTDLEQQFFEKEVGKMYTLTCHPWTVGTQALLLGDASHAITPFYGQGMNAGFEDCYELCQLYDHYGGDWTQVLPQWETKRMPNARAIGELALKHFLELRDHVNDPSFLLKKKIDARLFQEYPDHWVPMFSQISFTNTPYKTAIEAGEKQASILESLMAIPHIDRDWEQLDFSQWIHLESLSMKANRPTCPLFHCMEKEFIDWQAYYQENELEEMPWFYPHLSPDIKAYLEEAGIEQGHFLDIGTGAGTQAVGLARLGFQVTATDLVAAKWDRFKALDLNLKFVVDDILDSQLSPSFDYVFDRGCFHNLAPDQRRKFVTEVHRLLAPGGLLFMKCFSLAEPRTGPRFPYKFSCESLAESLAPEFTIFSCKETIFRGSMAPKALFSVFKKNPS